MDDITAKDILIPLDSYPHVPHWFSLRQAIVEMEKTQLDVGGRKSLPRVVLVFDEKYRLMGMVRRRDILRGLGRDAMQETMERTGETDPGLQRDLRSDKSDMQSVLADLRARSDRPVRDVMTPIRVSLPSTAVIMDIITIMVINDISIVPVLENDVIIGVVRSADGLHRIGNMII